MPVIEENRVLVTSDQPVEQMEARPGLNFFAPQADLVGEKLQRTKYVPEELFETFLNEAMKQVHPKRLEDGTWFTEIPGFTGVWGAADDLEKSVAELREALFDWLVLKIEHSDRDIPRIGDLTLNIF